MAWIGRTPGGKRAFLQPARAGHRALNLKLYNTDPSRAGIQPDLGPLNLRDLAPHKTRHTAAFSFERTQKLPDLDQLGGGEWFLVDDIDRIKIASRLG